MAKREAQSRPMSGMSTPGGAPGSSPPLSRAATPPAKGLAQVHSRTLLCHPLALVASSSCTDIQLSIRTDLHQHSPGARDNLAAP